MLFNSYEYIFAFLPVTLAVFFFLAPRFGREIAIVWLVLASLFYYGWWNPYYLGLILLSMAVNYGIGRAMARRGASAPGRRKSILVLGIAFNLGLLGYYKYTNFFIDNLNAALDTSFTVGAIVLPLGISFFTFQQIAYLADVHQGKAREYNFSHYALFITFFPQLIAGPIVHHADMMRQFARDRVFRPQYRNVAIGLSIFAIGLFKKAVLADGIASHATPVFAAAHQGEALTLFQAWGGVLSYTFQLYFDFSGYSDMAIGSARLFGIRLPLNFFSPYKSTSIIEFWRRWHMTLSRFLRNYLYIPLGGSRKGHTRRYVNLLTTMVLGGFWHGAGWTFLFWGLLHGLYLIVNHAWHWLCRHVGLETFRQSLPWRVIAWTLTFIAVVTGWAFFRADSLEAALIMIRGMYGLNGIALPNALVATLGPQAKAVLSDMGIGTYLGGGREFVFTYLWIAALLPIALILPNVRQIMRRFRPTIDDYPHLREFAVQPLHRLAESLQWRPSRPWAIAMAVIAAGGILALSSVSEFLYFQF